MKRIKIFVASSAELDQDKTLFDLFISDKNKIYRERYIDFELRTWKDFVSAITLTRLQEKYNEYIQSCDIVVFLFHTRVGQYTLEEFEVAHRQFIRSKGKKPLIYVYFKDYADTTVKIPLIEEFKEMNIGYGHFYDTYSSNEELLKKFDRQLQELENTGVIKPDPVDIKRIIRYGLFYILLPLLILGLGYFTFEYFTPLQTTVRINEVHGIPSLPYESGEITLMYADKQEKQIIRDEVIFKQIAAKYKGKKAKINFTSKGYKTIDTVVSLKKLIDLPVERDNSLGIIFGTVKDEYNVPLGDVAVAVQDLKVYSDELGQFKIEIPMEKQKEEQRLTAYKEGFQLWDFTSAPSQTVEWKIILRK
jgi:hypothetical protein